MSKYTYEMTDSKVARDHALKCLSDRPDDFLSYGKILGMDAIGELKLFMELYPKIKFVMVYLDGSLVNTIPMVKELEGNTISVVSWFTAPNEGNLDHFLNDLWSGFIEYLTSLGYDRFHAKFVVGHSAHRLHKLLAKTMPQYDFNFYLDQNPAFEHLSIDLTNR